MLQTKPKQIISKRDSVGIYLQEIGKIPLLSKEEEIRLARQIKDLQKLECDRSLLSDRIGTNPTDAELATSIGIEVKELRKRVFLGRAAKNKMVQSNLRLVVHLARKYLDRGLEIQELIQEGSLGVIRAAEKFDPDSGNKFSTYAYWWIRQGITRALINQSRSIRLPVNVWDKLNKIKKVSRKLTQELGRVPTDKEIAAELDIPLEMLRFIALSGRKTKSLDVAIGNGEDSTLGDLVQDRDRMEEQLFFDCLKEDLEKSLKKLPNKQAEVLRLRYGLSGNKPITLEQIGKRIDCSKERVRQLESKAISRLRQRDRFLKEYLA